MRTLSSNLLAAIMAEETSLVPLFLMTLSHDDMSDLVSEGLIDTSPLRVVNNGENIESDSETFVAMPFNCELPADTDKGPQKVRVTIDNVSRWLTPVVRSLRGPITVRLDIATRTDTASDGTPVYDNIEASSFDMDLENVIMTDQHVRGTLTFNNVLNTAFPGHKMTRTLLPGVA